MSQKKSLLKNKLLTILQKFARLRDTDAYGRGNCISCGANIHYTQGEGGYYIPRQYNNTAFELWNINLQCVHCNRYLHGNTEQYRQGLIAKYGEEILQEISQKSDKTPVSLADDWLQIQIIHRSRVVRDMESRKTPRT